MGFLNSPIKTLINQNLNWLWPIKILTLFRCGVCTTLRHTTVFTCSHANTPLGQLERAYYLSYFINLSNTYKVHQLYMYINQCSLESWSLTLLLIKNIIIFVGPSCHNFINIIGFWKRSGSFIKITLLEKTRISTIISSFITFICSLNAILSCFLFSSAFWVSSFSDLLWTFIIASSLFLFINSLSTNSATWRLFHWTGFFLTSWNLIIPSQNIALLLASSTSLCRKTSKI